MPDGIQIERSEHAQEFVIIGNSEARDHRLSFRARGLHHHLLSLPPGWRVTTAELAKEHPEGRDAIRAALSELVAQRYVTRERQQDGQGRWSTTMTVHDRPQPETDSGAPVTEDGFPGVGKPGVGGPGAKPKTGTEDGKDGPEDLASRRARAKRGRVNQHTLSEIIERTRAAAVDAYGEVDCAEVSDDEWLGLYFTHKGKTEVHDVRAYMAKIFGDAPYLDTFLANSEPVCVTCVQWESDCRCPAA